jgi:hypothetical protein
MRAGGCLCGAVRFTVAGPVRDIVVCHCGECRRWAGGPWPATSARRADLRITGEDALAWVPSPASGAKADRGSCARCGASLFWSAPGRDTISFGAGLLEDGGGLQVAAHIWTVSSPGWAEPPGGVQCYPEGYPADAPALSWR